MCLSRRADDERVELCVVEQLRVISVGRLEVVEPLQRFANGGARIRDRDELEAVAHVRKEVEMHRLGDETAADDPDAQLHARTCLATFSKANAISSRSCSLQSGETST